MKLTLLFLLCLALISPASLAQQREGEAVNHITVLISKQKVQAFHVGAEIRREDFLVYIPAITATQVRGLEFITFTKEVFATIGTAIANRVMLLAHLNSFIQPKHKCFEGVHRGQECTVHLLRLRL